jgi:hypothetical protein
MKKIKFTFIVICLSSFVFSQSTENGKLIELGKAYKDFMFRNEPPKDFVKDLQANLPENLKVATGFVLQTIKVDNGLLKQPFISLPENQTLKYIYIIHALSQNGRKENQIDNNRLIDSLKASDISKNELVAGYYSMLFTSIGNKNKPFDLGKFDFKLKDYNLVNDAEKGIFFLECMRYCGTEIWGYMNIVRPANTKKAFEYIKKFPKFNGLKYYQFNDLNFTDFEMVIVEDKGKQSYKGYFIDKYYDLLLSHLICLNKEGAKEKDINDLLLGSILRESSLYKYTKNKATLEKIVQAQK